MKIGQSSQMKISFTIGKETRCNAQAAKEGVGSKSGIQGVIRMKGIGCGKKVEWTQPEQPVGFSFEDRSEITKHIADKKHCASRGSGGLPCTAGGGKMRDK